MKTSLYKQCARMFMVGFPAKTVTPELTTLMDDGVYGAILFKHNVGTPEETAALCAELKRKAARPFLLAVDQEGGRVARLRGGPFIPVPSMRQVGAQGEAFARRIGKLLAFELRAVGFDWDFAPVVDVDTNPKNPVIGDRAFATDPHEVARLGVALAQGLEEGGVASCAKHFPGHGDTMNDSHLELPRLPHALDRLEAVELVPFAAYAKAKLASVMTAHVMFDALDPSVPATMSDRVLEGILRKKLGFQGVLVSDDLEMKAILNHFSVEDAVERGARAGVDLFLICHQAELQTRGIEALVRAVEAGRVSRARIEEANRRLDGLSARFSHPAVELLSNLGNAEHRQLGAGLSAVAVGRDPTESVA